MQDFLICILFNSEIILSNPINPHQPSEFTNSPPLSPQQCSTWNLRNAPFSASWHLTFVSWPRSSPVFSVRSFLILSAASVFLFTEFPQGLKLWNLRYGKELTESLQCVPPVLFPPTTTDHIAQTKSWEVKQCHECYTPVRPRFCVPQGCALHFYLLFYLHDLRTPCLRLFTSQCEERRLCCTTYPFRNSCCHHSYMEDGMGYRMSLTPGP